MRARRRLRRHAKGLSSTCTILGAYWPLPGGIDTTAVAFTRTLSISGRSADLDRPQEGLLNVSQQAMVELQTRLHAR